MLHQRADLSKRVEAGELEAVVEIGPDVYGVRTDPSPEAAGDTQVIRWQAKKPGEDFVARYLDRRINDAIQRQRLASAGIDPAQVRALQQPVPLKPKGLTRPNPQTGQRGHGRGSD